MALLQPFTRPAPAPLAMTDHLRRCTYRRLVAVRRQPSPIYAAECLYPDRRVPIPLADLEAARPICAACTADHIFRPDED